MKWIYKIWIIVFLTAFSVMAAAQETDPRRLIESIIESHLDKIIDSEKSVPLKDAYIKYQSYCLSEGIKIVSSKIDFSSALQSEGYWVNNSKKHANQVRIFASELEALN